MRLNKIRLAGFKSFVDPITIRLPGDLTAIVGPNGCGKSNIIDAVRWVMGEISAKHLRGDTMADIVFTGSNTRKPVGQASVELVFDNSDGRLEGRYAAYNEVAIKRQVTRDSQSVYYLNATRCRRRDVTDVFFGTGLGPRSYAIIEQGMISRLIEARPEELRDFLEEAAGISKYKERRRETENRIRHTTENLERLEDLREELAKRLQHLKRQATMAEKYKVLKQQERELRAELLALRWLALDAEAKAKNDEVQQQENAMEAAVAEQRRLESELERGRAMHGEATEEFNEVYRRVLDAEAAIARGEEAIQSLRRQRDELNEGLGREQSRLASAREHVQSEERRLERLRADLAEREPELERVQQTAAEARLAFRESEEAVHAWQADWEEWSEQAAKPARARDAEAARIQHLEQALENLESRERRLAEDRDELEADDAAHGVADTERRLQEDERAVAERQAVLDGLREEVQRLREQERDAAASLHATRERSQALRGRLASLQALQQQALGKGGRAASSWLERAGLGGEPRLAEAIRAAPGWEGALEAVLGFRLEAVCVDGLDRLAGSLARLEEGALTLFEKGAQSAVSSRERDAPAPTLLEKVSAPWPLDSLLAGVHTADSLEEALALRPRLAAADSVVTRDGIWVGRGWVRVARAADERAGVLAREQEIKALAAEFAELEAEAERRSRDHERLQRHLTEAEAALEAAQTELAAAHRRHAASKAALGAAHAEQEQSRRRAASLGTELADVASQLAAEKEVLAQARRRWRESSEELDRLDVEREQWVRRRDEHRRRLEECRDRWQEVRDEAYDLGLEVQSLRSQMQSLEESRGRNHEQVTQLEARIEEMRGNLEANDAPLAAAKGELEEKLQARSRIEERLKAARERVETAQARVGELERQRQAKEEAVGAERDALERLRLEAHETSVRRATVEEQFGGGRAELAALVEQLPGEAAPEAWEERLETLERRINRLGPINLAAIEEHEQLAERKQYLDAQHEDLTEALETLTAAIAKIDRETRARFKETYEKVNAGLGQMFPRLFGGGHAYLQLTGDDLLSTGVSVMARPPGKRNTSIHLLSGGEKALAAIALVFAIFELNPAPFCLLDEVDAPLDDVNVVRFCELVKDMSERTQFVIVTHNKITMEIAHQLIGVTMNEPGVSRLVAVDVDEAVEMVAV